jgi:hypothetical protein
LTFRLSNSYAATRGEEVKEEEVMEVNMKFRVLAVLSIAMLLHIHAIGPAYGEEKRLGFHQINERIGKGIRQVSLAKTDEQIAEAVFDLTELHREVVADPRFTESGVLQGYRRRIASKLRQAERDISRELKNREKRPSLAQSKDPLESEYVGQVVSHQLSLVGLTLGGPSRLLDEVTQRGGFGGRGIPDFGNRLVQLIQSTISPKAWDVNGGPATIIYYRPLFLLVVRAPMDVQ